MAENAKWTWLVYMAGDNNLEGAGREDIKEMKRIGSTDKVNVIVQFDTEQNITTRYRVERNKIRTIKRMTGVNCGNPKVLTDFIKWGMSAFPADHYLVDIWNHGGGWENLPADFNYASIRSLKPRMAGGLQRLRTSLFKTTALKFNEMPMMERAIAIDCGSRDYLDNQELRTGIADALPGSKKIDILGCDACLMNMFEIAYEMKDTAHLMVGSEETEPAAGWPYASILEELVATPEMMPDNLAKLIVNKYGAWYEENGDPVADRYATQSALTLDNISTLATAVSSLAAALLKDLKKVAGIVSLARNNALKFEYPEYIDLGDFAKQLVKALPKGSDASNAAAKIVKLTSKSGKSGFVIENSTWGSRVSRATGVSIYFPNRDDYSSDYVSLRFSQDGKWRELLEALFKI